MKKSDLKTGMIATRRDGMEFVVFVDAINKRINDSGTVFVNASKYMWHKAENFNNDLTHSTNKYWDIVKVELASHPYNYMDLNYEENKRQLLWEREEVKEMTMKELEEHFGCKVKIVKEHSSNDEEDDLW